MLTTDGLVAARIGDTVRLGIKDDAGMSKCWIVVNVQPDRAILLCSPEDIFVDSYHECFTPTDWSKVAFRQKLNNQFFDSAFSSFEKNLILETNNITGDVETSDKVFLPSIEDIQKFELSRFFKFRNYPDLALGLRDSVEGNACCHHLFDDSGKGYIVEDSVYHKCRMLPMIAIKCC